jgi:hypothetical protein
MLQPIADRIYQHNPTESSACDLFDESAQGIKKFRERTSGGQHFEKAVFSGKQCFSLCAVFAIGLREVIGRG